MLTRRAANIAILGSTALLTTSVWSADASTDGEALFDDVEYPPTPKRGVIEFPGNLGPLGIINPNKPQVDAAQKALDQTPKSTSAVNVAQSFIDRFNVSDPDFISQWPKAAAWNPLVVQFFSATDERPRNDLVPWCAAFTNWCIERSGRKGSNSTSSQSFVNHSGFTPVSIPQRGDLAVFTCHSWVDGKVTKLGHVGFFSRMTADGKIYVIGGNQLAGGRSMICEKYIQPPVKVVRTIDAKKVPFCMELNSFLRIG